MFNNFIKLIKCNLFHRHNWYGIRDIERQGYKPKQCIVCTECDPDWKDYHEKVGEPLYRQLRRC